MSPALARLFGSFAGCPFAVVIPTDSGKKLHPVAAEVDPAPLFAGQIAGRIPPVLCRKDDGTEWTEHHGRALAVRLINDEGRCAAIGLDFDAGAGHRCNTTPEVAQDAARFAFGVLRDAGLPALLAASGGGTGRHVWCWLPCAISAEAAVWIAALVRRMTLERFPTASIECRPAKVSNTGGQPLTLPGGGWSPSPGGGRILEVAEVTSADAVRALDRLLAHHDVVQRRQEVEAEARRQERERRLATLKPGDVESRDVDLEAVAEVVGEVVRRHGAELHVRCPGCSGTVKIRGGKRAWACFACGQGGVGDAAAYLLAKWLRQTTEPAVVFDVLRAAHGGAHV